MQEEILEIFSTLFNRPISPDEDFSMDTQSDWDSMKHIEVIMTLEEELGLSFEAADIPHLTSIAKITKKIQEMKS